MFKKPLLLLGALSLTGCSFQSTLDGVINPKRQKYFESVANDLCTKTSAVRALLMPELRPSMDEALTKLAGECPGEQAKWKLTSYQWRTNAANGTVERIEEIVAVAKGKTRWSTVEFRFQQIGDQPSRIIAWRVIGSKTRPPSLQYVENFDANAKVMRLALPLGLLLLVGLTIWLIRRERRRHG